MAHDGNMTTTNTTHAADPNATAFLGPDDTIRISAGCGREIALASSDAAPTCGLCAAMRALYAPTRREGAERRALLASFVYSDEG